MTRISEAKTISVPCPKCGESNTIPQRAWFDSMLTEYELDCRAKRPIIPTKWRCSSCKQDAPMRDWHRAAEREIFKLKGWTTPRMEREGE